MLHFKRSKLIAEHEARGEIERVYHEVRETLRVTGVNLNFRTWARYEKFFPMLWEAVRPNAETRRFEEAADRLRADAVRMATAWERPGIAESVPLGESQRYHLRAALTLYHYINPKLLVLTSSVGLALAGEPIGGGPEDMELELIERGAPARMYPMDMVEEEPRDESLRILFEDIKRTLSLASVNSDYRTLALWPSYLQAAWAWLKPILARENYHQASMNLLETARTLARTLPYPVPLSYARVQSLQEDVNEIVTVTAQFESLLPSLILNIALLGLEWQTPEDLARSPFPAGSRPRPLQGQEI